MDLWEHLMGRTTPVPAVLEGEQWVSLPPVPERAAREMERRSSQEGWGTPARGAAAHFHALVTHVGASGGSAWGSAVDVGSRGTVLARLSGPDAAPAVQRLRAAGVPTAAVRARAWREGNGSWRVEVLL